MIGEHKKRINLTLHEMTVDMLETISIETGLTKSQIMRQLLKSYTLIYWSDPKSENETWKKWKDSQDEKK